MTQTLTVRRPQENVLRALALYHFLTNKQINTVIYKGNAESTVRRDTRWLHEEKEFLRKTRIDHPVYDGSGEYVYSLSGKGLRYLREQGMVINHRAKPSEVPESTAFLKHMKDLNDFLIAAATLHRDYPEIELVEMQHEQDLKREPFVVETKQDKKMSLCPDAWLHFRWADGVRGEPRHVRIWLEVDRGTEHRSFIRRKVRGILACADGPYRRRFGTNNITVVFLATHGYGRVDELTAWIKDELKEIGAKDKSDLFRIGEPKPGKNLFLDPIWETPWSMQIRPLLPVKGGYESI